MRDRWLKTISPSIISKRYECRSSIEDSKTKLWTQAVSWRFQRSISKGWTLECQVMSQRTETLTYNASTVSPKIYLLVLTETESAEMPKIEVMLVFATYNSGCKKLHINRWCRNSHQWFTTSNSRIGSYVTTDCSHNILEIELLYRQLDTILRDTKCKCENIIRMVYFNWFSQDAYANHMNALETAKVEFAC